jgi:hypothetical protein
MNLEKPSIQSAGSSKRNACRMPIGHEAEMYKSEFRVDLLPSQMLKFQRGDVIRSRGAEYFVAVLDDKLHCIVFGMHVSHFSINAEISHDRRCEDHGKILRCHL